MSDLGIPPALRVCSHKHVRQTHALHDVPLGHGRIRILYDIICAHSIQGMAVSSSLNCARAEGIIAPSTWADPWADPADPDCDRGSDV